MRLAIDLLPDISFKIRREIRDGAHLVRKERDNAGVIDAADVPDALLLVDVVVAAEAVRDRRRAGDDADEAARRVCDARDSRAVAPHNGGVVALDASGEAGGALDVGHRVAVVDVSLRLHLSHEAAAIAGR